MFSQMKSRRPSSASSKFSSFRCDAVDTEAALTLINERDALLPFAYVVFPSATHLAGNQWQGEVFGMACDAAWLSLCSGTGFRQTARRQGIELSTLSLPDFASVLFGRVLKASDPVNLVGATPEVAAALRTRLHLEGPSPPRRARQHQRELHRPGGLPRVLPRSSRPVHPLRHGDAAAGGARRADGGERWAHRGGVVPWRDPLG